MIFNSLDFAIFLPIVFFLYWFVCNKTVARQNVLVVVASYVFYGWWDYRFLALILFSTIVDFGIGRLLLRTDVQKKRKLLLGISISINLGLLGFFKYYNFFAASFVDAFSFFGHSIQPNTLDIILPVGISFYTFQTLSYSIDVYRKKLEPTSSFIEFAAFVSFFPQLVAGPIERATNLLPQFKNKRDFKYAEAMDGVYLIIWGLFKKVVIADNCAQFANDIFQHSENYSSSTLLLGTVYFAFQIYGDFSGYSDMAIGTSKLFGFNLMQNFAVPYFARDMAEFWRRWHISLSTWFRDYLYIPLGGSRGSKWQQIRNVFIIFIVSGFWHGANWTFLMWGLLNALYFIPLLLLNRNRVHTNVIAEHNILPSIKEIVQVVLTFTLTLLAWVFFRANTISDAFLYLERLFQFSFKIDRLNLERFSYEMVPLVMLLIGVEWFSRRKQHPLDKIQNQMVWSLVLIFLIFVFGSFSNVEEFIYFQF
ncbi:MBOAT family O-acyltransferase [Winogradskyella sediminis]|uniref:D-alanyl-lipoteichoic acid acyltransferase DltB, MBOAT superfamily n=1 Tax=Winogradskyella sediminis TaxID=1382466 RepID=A0A1H1VJI8_9FLAO|nr:MBOAT family O-acyltransferase [Winogradskyella sediminis]SDS84511.1 D-alanyl-lipoteichoic acid acyltransferase DltB, MBOAT superfamily [Winogradskyella sediminis]